VSAKLREEQRVLRNFPLSAPEWTSKTALAAAGTFSFDGQGNASRSFIVSFGGVVGPNRDTGSYKVHPNCTASATFPDGNWKMVIVSHGTEIKAINATPGILVQGTLTLQ
jgi:hypothetical protein